MTTAREEAMGMSRQELVWKLVLTGHLNTFERQQLVPPEVSFDEVVGVVRSSLESNGYFPPNARPLEPPPSYEGGIIESLPDGGVRLHWQRNYAWTPVVAEHTCKDYRRLEDALQEFMRWEWRNSIDGVRIGEPPARRPWWRRTLG